MRLASFSVFLLLVFLPGAAFGQLTQVIRGTVLDKANGMPLPGVVVHLLTDNKINAATDVNGHYRMPEVPVGRQTLIFRLAGYKPQVLQDIIVSSGKELELNIEMEESAVLMNEVEVKAVDSGLVNSTTFSNLRTISIEETERYPGSRQDPARMVQNIAGVQGTNDSRNDIVVRGNSPAGILWRLDDIDIPNPNHFAVAGSMGGPQSIINDKTLGNNNAFYTGAFPANYGNAIGGVFDLKMRNGNNEKHERSLQLGILGTEVLLEGPLNKASGASYLVTYRYSTLALFGSINFKIGTSAIPNYQDGALRINLPTKRAGVFSISGIAGGSNVNIVLSTVKTRPTDLYGDLNRDQYFNSSMSVGILSHVIPIGKKSIMKTSIAYSTQSIWSRHKLIIRDVTYMPKDTLPLVLWYNFYENKGTFAWFIKTKVNSRNNFKTGFFVNLIDVNYFDKTRINTVNDTIASDIEQKPFKVRENFKTSFVLAQPYVTYDHAFNDNLSLTTGVFMQWLSLNNSAAVEPRASLIYRINQKTGLVFSYGLHSQMQASYLYFTIPDSIQKNGVMQANVNREMTNRNLGFTRSQHFVGGFNYVIAKHLRTKIEVYYQNLWNIPVYVIPSSYSALNRGATFNRFYPVYPLVNQGTGYNYGVELTLEKQFYKNYFFMVNTSLYQSKYKGSNGVTSNTDFNGNYVVNLLGGYEYKVGSSKKDVLTLGARFCVAGGKRYSPVNIAASNAIMDIVPIDNQINSLQFPSYQRLDFKISYRINGKRTGIEFSADLVNVLNRKNILALSYTPDPTNRSADPYTRNYQLGFLPLFYVRFDF